jgi:hypothetical protein
MTPAQVKPPILPELLDQIDIRVGTIESVSDVANSDSSVARPALRLNPSEDRWQIQPCIARGVVFVRTFKVS